MMSGGVKIESQNEQLYKKLVRIAGPIAVQGVVSATLGLVDNLMVGFLGEAELASVGIATQIFYIFYLVLFGFTSGTATFVAQFFGVRDFANIRRVTGFSVAVALCGGVLFFIGAFFFTEQILSIYSSDPEIIAMAAPYVKIGAVTLIFMAFSVPLEMAFKATQQTRVPMIVSGVVFFTNVILNYCLIFGKFGMPKMGVAGASLATTIARFLEVFIMIFFAARKSNCFHGPVSAFCRWKKDMIFRVLKNSLPTTINELLWSVGQSMYVAAFSRISTTAYAAFQAASSINNIFAFAAFSIGDGTLILVGEKLGQGEKEETYRLAKKLLKVGVTVGVLIGLCLIFSAKPMTGLFNLSAEGKFYTQNILLVYGCLMGLNLYNGMNITGTLRAGGDTTFAMAAEASCLWVISVPLAFIGALVLHLPIYLAVLLMKADEIIKCVILTKRFISKKWVNTVITGL